jgi:hypothetical protein
MLQATINGMHSHYTSPIKRKMGTDGETNVEFERHITPKI